MGIFWIIPAAANIWLAWRRPASNSSQCFLPVTSFETPCCLFPLFRLFVASFFFVDSSLPLSSFQTFTNLLYNTHQPFPWLHLPLPYFLLLYIPITYLLLPFLIFALNLFASSACLSDECARPPFVTVSSPRFVLCSKQLLYLCPNVSSTGLDFESKNNVCNFSLVPICLIFPIVARAKFICAKDYQKAKFIFCLSPALKAFNIYFLALWTYLFMFT